MTYGRKLSVGLHDTAREAGQGRRDGPLPPAVREGTDDRSRGAPGSARQNSELEREFGKALPPGATRIWGVTGRAKTANRRSMLK